MTATTSADARRNALLGDGSHSGRQAGFYIKFGGYKLTAKGWELRANQTQNPASGDGFLGGVDFAVLTGAHSVIE